jgi:hypothetical protein
MQKTEPSRAGVKQHRSDRSGTEHRGAVDSYQIDPGPR